MKKILSLIFAVASFSIAMAQPMSQPGEGSSWQHTITGVLDASDVNRTAPVAITGDGDVYATGRFNQLIATENLFLEPIAQSAYVIKYDKNGNEIWGVALAGSATIKSIVTDADENVYVAGTMADQVVFNTTSGESVTLSGAIDEWGDYVTTQTTSFIAKYNAEGVLQVAKAFVPARHPDVNGMKDDIMGPYYFPEEDGSFKINALATDGNKVYASANYCGQTDVEGLTFTGSLINIYFFMIDNLKSGAVFSLSADKLDNAELIADFNSSESLTYDLAYNITSINFTLNENTVYAGAIGQGNITMTTPAGKENFEFVLPGDGSAEYGHIIAAINGQDVSFKTYAAPANYETSKESIDNMQVYGNALYIAGVFNNILAFNNNKVSTNNTDLYVVALNKETLDCGGAWVSGYDEQETNKNQEIFTSMIVADGDIYLNGYNEQISGHAIVNNLSFIIDETGINGGNAETLITGAAKNETSLVFAGINDYKSTVYYYNNVLTDIETAKTTGTTTIQYAQGELLFSETCDVELWSMQGYIVRCAYGVTALNVNHLSKGCYIVKAKTANSTTTYKFAKK